MINKMNNVKYTDNELNLMSYQELRRLSILLRLPANIKKTYMISMIQAHQKGDGFTKTAIANKVMEERKVKRLTTTKGRQKPYIMVSTTTQQIPTDLSVSTKHEFETRFSYVAHYTSKDNTSSGISRIIKEEAEVSRRNRNILQQPRKSSRKLSTMGRTEIMLPRNHSLTTPVRLMPQYERSFGPMTQYETVPGLSNAKAHFQDAGSYNYHFHGEYSNTIMSSSSHEMYRNESYWNPREIYNNSLMPILSSLLTANNVSINSTGFAPQYGSQNSSKPQSSFQGIYEKYVKSSSSSSSMVEGQMYQPNGLNSTLMVNGHCSGDENGGGHNESTGAYLVAKRDGGDFDVNSPEDNAGYQQYSRRDDTVIRHSNGVLSHHEEDYEERNDNDLPTYEEAMRRRTASHHATVKLSNPTQYHQSADHQEDYERSYSGNRDATELWDASDGNESQPSWKTSVDRPELAVVPVTEAKTSFLSDVSESASDYMTEVLQPEPWDKRLTKDNRFLFRQGGFSGCRYILGHSKYPETTCARGDVQSALPSFSSTFSAYGTHNKVYSLCRNSFTGTTETHTNPIMTSTQAKQYAHGSTQLTSNNPEESPQVPRPWLYAYGEPPQSSFATENATYSAWNEYSGDAGEKLMTHDNAHEVQVVKCRKHGCHYLYSVSNSCNQTELQKDRGFEQTTQIKPFI